MSYFLTVFLSYILLYRYATLIGFVFLGTFLLPLPLNAMYFAVGAFASQGYFNIFVLFIVAFSTNTLSDCFGYFLTYRYEKNILKIIHVDPEGEKFKKIEKWLRQYSGETVFFTRIAGPFSATVNFLSGLIEVPFKKFLFADMAGNFIDISFFIVAGYFLGNYWEEFLKNIQNITIIIFTIFIVSLLIRIYGKKILSLFKKGIEQELK